MLQRCLEVSKEQERLQNTKEGKCDVFRGKFERMKLGLMSLEAEKHKAK